MRPIVIALLVAGQLFAVAEPACAASFDGRYVSLTQSSAFAGARLRIPLGAGAQGGSGAAKARFGLTFAPMLRSQSSEGRAGVRIGEGVGFGLAGERSVGLTIGGRSLIDLGARGDKIDPKKKVGISTVGVVAIGVGVAVVGGLLIFADALNDASE